MTASALGNGIDVHVVPTHHWSARGMLDRRMALWASFVLTDSAGTILLVGDSGFHDGIYYRQIAEKFGPFRFSFLPIGAYEPRWFMAAQHQNPDEAVQAHKILRSENTLGHHWGTFKLTDEGIERPLEALAAAREKHDVSARIFSRSSPALCGRHLPRDVRDGMADRVQAPHALFPCKCCCRARH